MAEYKIRLFFFQLQKNEDVTIVLDEGSKRERGSNRSKEKREKTAYEEIEVRKDKRERVSRKRNL